MQKLSRLWTETGANAIVVTLGEPLFAEKFLDLVRDACSQPSIRVY